MENSIMENSITENSITEKKKSALDVRQVMERIESELDSKTCQVGAGRSA